MGEWNKDELKKRMEDLLHILDEVERGVLPEDACKEAGYAPKRVGSILNSIGRLKREQYEPDGEDSLSPDDETFTDADFRQKAIIRCQGILLSEIGSDSWNSRYPDIMSCGLSSRSINALHRESCITLYDLLGFSDDQLKRLRNFGLKCMKEVKDIASDIAHRMFGMSAKDLADVVYSIPKDAELEMIKQACLNTDIWDIGLETTIRNSIARDMLLRDICHEGVSLYDLMNPASSLFKSQIFKLGKEKLHAAQEDINSFVLKRFGMSAGSLSDLLYHR